MTTLTMFTGGVSSPSSSVVPDPIRDPFDAPFALLTRPAVGHCSAGSSLNWDGTPAHSSGTRGHHTGQPPTISWGRQGGAA